MEPQEMNAGTGINDQEESATAGAETDQPSQNHPPVLLAPPAETAGNPLPENSCPKCSHPMRQEGLCFYCPAYGWSKCG